MKKKTPVKHPLDDFPVKLRLRVAEEILARHHTIAEVSRMSNVHRNTISNLCNNPMPRQVDCRVIAAIAYALDLKDPGVLFEFSVK